MRHSRMQLDASPLPPIQRMEAPEDAALCTVPRGLDVKPSRGGAERTGRGQASESDRAVAGVLRSARRQAAVALLACVCASRDEVCARGFDSPGRTSCSTTTRGRARPWQGAAPTSTCRTRAERLLRTSQPNRRRAARQTVRPIRRRLFPFLFGQRPLLPNANIEHRLSARCLAAVNGTRLRRSRLARRSRLRAAHALTECAPSQRPQRAPSQRARSQRTCSQHRRRHSARPQSARPHSARLHSVERLHTARLATVVVGCRAPCAPP